MAFCEKPINFMIKFIGYSRLGRRDNCYLVMDIALYTVLPGAHARIRVVDQVDQESDVSQFLFYNIDFQGAKTLLS